MRQYLLEAKNVTPAWLTSPCASRAVDGFRYRSCGPIYGIYTNFFVSRIGFWLRPDVQHFLGRVAASNTIYSARWGDVLWHATAIQIFSPQERVRMLHDFAYEHATFRTARATKCL